MTTRVQWLNNPYLLAVLLLGGVSVDLILLGRWLDLSKSDWGTWVGSIGTVATLAGTIYLARTEARRREKAEKDLALIAAADFSIRIPELQSALIQAKKWLYMHRDHTTGISFAPCVDIIDRGTLWQPSDLTPLLYIGRRLAARLGLAQAEALSVIQAMRQADRSGSVRQNGKERHFSDAMIGRIDAAYRHLNGTRNECLMFMLASGVDDAFALSESADPVSGTT